MAGNIDNPATDGWTLKITGRRLSISNPDKVFFPQSGLTKGDIIEYYRRIAPTILPHLEDRPLSLFRAPDGLNGEGFFQKQAPDYFPDWVPRVTLPKEGGEVDYTLCNDAPTLVYLADQACITPHVFLSRRDAPTRPDRFVIDLDPPDSDGGEERFGFELVRKAARRLGEQLRALRLAPFLMTTGSRGLHVVVPIDRQFEFGTVRAFATRIAESVCAQEPDEFTTAQRKANRGNRVYFDVARNGWAQTVVAPYAVRQRPNAPVATPLDWEEISDGELMPGRYHIRNMFRRLGQKRDPWKNIQSSARPIPQERDWPRLDG